MFTVHTRQSVQKYISYIDAYGLRADRVYIPSDGWRSWSLKISNSDLDNRFAVVGNNTAIQTVQATTMYRLQLSATGNLSMFKSIDGGKTWPQSKAVASFETT